MVKLSHLNGNLLPKSDTQAAGYICYFIRCIGHLTKCVNRTLVLAQTELEGKMVSCLLCKFLASIQELCDYHLSYHWMRSDIKQRQGLGLDRGGISVLGIYQSATCIGVCSFVMGFEPVFRVFCVFCVFCGSRVCGFVQGFVLDYSSLRCFQRWQLLWTSW
jgi:hypothetical protein